MNILGNRHRDYMLVLLDGPRTELQLRHAVQERDEAGTSHEKARHGRRPKVQVSMRKLVADGWVTLEDERYALTPHGELLAAEVRRSLYFRRDRDKKSRLLALRV